MSALAVIAALAYNAMILVGCAYIVFWRDASGWWFLLACLLLAQISSKGE